MRSLETKPPWSRDACGACRADRAATRPYRFFFSSDGAEPRHIHVERGRHRAEVWLDPVRLGKGGGFSLREAERILRFVREHAPLLRRAWNEYFVD